MILEATQNCPRCGSKKTGTILLQNSTGNLNQEIKEAVKEANKGHLSRFVSPHNYRSYYGPENINLFCSECGYEFRGEISKEDVSKEEFQKRIKENGVFEWLCIAENRTKWPFRIAARIKLLTLHKEKLWDYC